MDLEGSVVQDVKRGTWVHDVKKERELIERMVCGIETVDKRRELYKLYSNQLL